MADIVKEQFKQSGREKDHGFNTKVNLSFEHPNQNENERRDTPEYAEPQLVGVFKTRQIQPLNEF